MTPRDECPCWICKQDPLHAEALRHRYLRSLMDRLDEQQRRWFAAIEVLRHGHGGTRLVAEITGLDKKTIRRGLRELQDGVVDVPSGRIRRVGAGRPRTEKKAPALFSA